MRYSYKALQVDVTENLQPLSAVLYQQGVDHRIFEERGQQVVMVADTAHAEKVTALYEAWREGKVRIEAVPQPHRAAPERSGTWLVYHALLTPVTIVLLLLSFAGFLLIFLNPPVDWLSALTFTPFEIVNGRPQFIEVYSQYWRYFTPAFLHFGWLHIAFNSLWLWELGSKIEKQMGSVNMALLFLSIALVSNTAQFVFGGPGLFGGMSGVVYGLLGFSWVGALVQPAWTFSPPKTILIMMLGWLVVCLAGVVEVLGFGAIANAAHLGGLLAGMVLGSAFGMLSRFTADES